MRRELGMSGALLAASLIGACSSSHKEVAKPPVIEHAVPKQEANNCKKFDIVFKIGEAGVFFLKEDPNEKQDIYVAENLGPSSSSQNTVQIQHGLGIANHGNATANFTDIRYVYDYQELRLDESDGGYADFVLVANPDNAVEINATLCNPQSKIV